MLECSILFGSKNKVDFHMSHLMHSTKQFKMCDKYTFEMVMIVILIQRIQAFKFVDMNFC